MVRSMFYLLLLNLSAFMGCSLFFNTVSVDVPKGYQGWAYVIPVRDTIGFTFNVSPDGHYKTNEDGVAYVPAILMNPKEDLQVKIYEGGLDITEDTRYFGRVATSNSTDNKKYSYVSFLLPADNEKTIPDTDVYWRDSSFSYGKQERAKFDSLLKKNKIIFR
jgi:hypothetical protein